MCSMKYLQSDPDIAGGELTIKGTRNHYCPRLSQTRSRYER